MKKAYNKKMITSLEKMVQGALKAVQEAQDIKQEMEDQNYLMTSLTPVAVDESHMVKLGYKNYKNLPLPRMEMRGIKYEAGIIWIYGLVHIHWTGVIKFIPFSETRQRKSHPVGADVERELPMRDSVHFRTEYKMLNLPGFIVWDNNIHNAEDIFIKTGTIDDMMYRMKRESKL